MPAFIPASAFTPALNPAGAKPRENAERINLLQRGKLNTTGQITLDTGSATTLLEHPEIGFETFVGLSPITANAKAEGHPWVSIAARGAATLNHANNAQADRTYRVLIVG